MRGSDKNPKATFQAWFWLCQLQRKTSFELFCLPLSTHSLPLLILVSG